VRLALERHGFSICAEAGDATAAIEAALRERPDLCLVDVELPGNGIAATAEITAKLPGTPVVVFTESQKDADLFDSLRAGASGYLPKDIDPAGLPRTLRAVLNGEAALPRHLVARLVDELRGHGQHRALTLADGRHVDLTIREWDVLELLREGLPTAEIARRLFVSPGTVRTHVAALLRKLDVFDRKEAVRLLEER
jgi:DNA-binding NarL/FixJ family response regulator